MIEIEPEGSWFDLYAQRSKEDKRFYSSESVAHPAKMSIRLTKRILEQMLEWGWIESGRTTLVDCFGGLGTTAIEWLRLDANNAAITCELEPPFVQMQRDNRLLLIESGSPANWQIWRGDSRRLDELMLGDFASTRAMVDKEREALRAEWQADYRAVAFQPLHAYADAVGKPWVNETWHDRTRSQAVPAVACGSPPYGAGVIGRASDPERLKALVNDPKSSLFGRDPEGQWFKAMCDGYHNSPGNIDNLPSEADLSVCSSPPYGDTEVRQPSGSIGDAWKKNGQHARDTFASPDGSGKDLRWYGATEGQIGFLPDDLSAVSSPPYEDCLSSDNPDRRGGLFRDPKRRNDRTLTSRYQPLATVTSPPFEAQSGGHPMSPEGPLADERLHARHAASKVNAATGYAGNVNGQIGMMQRETYSSACLQVYQALWRANVRYVALVTKNPISKGELKPLDTLTIRLMAEAGYELVARRKAWLWEYVHQLRARGKDHPRPLKPKSATDERYWDNWENRPVGRLSFFHLLHLAKGRRAPAQAEDCLFFRRIDG